MKARTKMKTLLLLGVLLFGFTVSAQSQKVSLDFKNERVEKVLASIKSQTGMSLVFSDQLVDVNRKVTMQLKDVTLKEALTRLLSGINLTFEIRNNKIYFIEKKAVSQPGSRKKRVTGVVKDVMGEPLIGANVVEKGRRGLPLLHRHRCDKRLLSFLLPESDCFVRSYRYLPLITGEVSDQGHRAGRLPEG